MAEAFALAASVIGVLGFTLQLWTETKEIRKTGSTIETADCARDAESLQKLCDQVKALQNARAETNLAEAASIKQIAAEIREVAEELAAQLAKCELPADQKGLRRYRDVISVLWHGMRMDVDSQMRRLATLRNELQSELLVSMSKKLDLGALRQSAWFQTLDSDVKHHADIILQEQRVIKTAIDDMDASAERRHAQVLQRLDRLPFASPSTGYDPEARKRERIRELCDRLWFDAIPRRHHSIKPAYQKTFEWIFTGQKKTAASNTTFQEWMTSSTGLYWISGRAGTGKSSLMRFLEDDPRTKPAFQQWAGQRKLVLATFYFWNSEIAQDDKLKSLSGLYRGILYSLIQQEGRLADLMFPNHFVDGRYWEKNFPTLLDMDEALERLANATELPAAVGLIIDGLDEYDATSVEQMTMAKNLLRASHSPNLKILVSSRPEDAFETIFKDSTKLRLHELTEGDRQTYTSDHLTALPRFKTIATEAQQAGLVDLIVTRSEGIFLWVYLAVETVLQEIPLSMDIARLEKVVEDIPGGNKELSGVFEHILRHRIPAKYQLVGYSLIRTLQFSYTLPGKFIPLATSGHQGYRHQITTILLSFFEDDIKSALTVPIGPLDKPQAISRAELGENLIRKSCAGLLESRDPEYASPESRSSEIDRPIHYIHKDLAMYLNHVDTSRFLEQQSFGANLSVQANLLKCFIIMMKFHNPAIEGIDESHSLTTQAWDIWRFIEGSMRIAQDAEVLDSESSVELLDEMDRLMVHLHSQGSLPSEELMPGMKAGRSSFLNPNDKTHWSDWFRVDRRYGSRFDIGYKGTDYPELSNFLAFTIAHGLVHYCASKISKDGKTAIKKAGLPLLISACGNERMFQHIFVPVQHKTVQILLQNGADPNEVFRNFSCWQAALATTRSFDGQGLDNIRELERILRLMLEAGANPHTRTIRGDESAVEVIGNTFNPTPGKTYGRRSNGQKALLTEDECLEIAKLGAGLLDLLREKQKATPEGTSTWRKAISRRTRIWQVRIQSRLSHRGKK